MKEYQSLSHKKWDCDYHVLFIPKRRKQQILGALRRHLGQILRDLAGHKESQVVERHLIDHVPMCIRIAPKYAASNVVGYMNEGQERDSDRVAVRRVHARFHGGEFLGARVVRFDRGAGRAAVRAYIREQEQEDER